MLCVEAVVEHPIYERTFVFKIRQLCMAKRTFYWLPRVGAANKMALQRLIRSRVMDVAVSLQAMTQFVVWLATCDNLVKGSGLGDMLI